MTPTLRGAVASVLVSVALLPGGEAIAQSRRPQPVDRARSNVVEGWLTRLSTAEDLLRNGEYKKARRITNDVLDEIIARVQSGESVGVLLGAAVLLRGLAEAGLGRDHEALWDWYSSKALDPTIGERDLSGLGPVASILERERQHPRSVSMTDLPAEAPRPIHRPPIDYPPAVLSACIEGGAIVSVIVGLDGRPAAPRVMAAPSGALMAFTSLEHIRKWRFEPGQRDGQAVETPFSITVNFEVPGCQNVFAVAAAGPGSDPGPLVTLPPPPATELPARLTIEQIDPSPEEGLDGPRMLRIRVRYEVPEASLAQGTVLLLPQFAQRRSDDTFLIQEPGARTRLTDQRGTTTLYYSMDDIWGRRLARPVRLWMHAVLERPDGTLESIGTAGPVVYGAD